MTVTYKTLKVPLLSFSGNQRTTRRAGSNIKNNVLLFTIFANLYSK